MGDISEHFNRRDFECHGNNYCNHSAPIDYCLIVSLELLRDEINRLNHDEEASIIVNSGFRCRRYNSAINGSLSSFHCLGMAADISPKNCSVLELVRCANRTPGFEYGGVGTYCTFVHVDIRKGGSARW